MNENELGKERSRNENELGIEECRKAIAEGAEELAKIAPDDLEAIPEVARKIRDAAANLEYYAGAEIWRQERQLENGG